ncbi:MAG: LysR family transcriptional regulator, partial [Peptococcaceae bacterium]|nr:LysR family transcriptional regulator [Peptococcaceae bacterium]
MRIDQIEYVVAAHQQQSISQAAESLFVTQPSLSRAITALEKELGVQLFHRT